MNGKERFLTSLGRRTPDRAPIFLRDLTLGLDESGLSTPEVCAGMYDADKASRSIAALHRRLDQDAVVGCIHYVGMEIELLGGQVRFPEWGIPSVVMHPFQFTNDPSFELLDLKRDGPFPNVLKCYAQVAESLGDTTAVVCNLEGPLTKAALLRGIENLALDMQFDPGLAGEYVNYATELGDEYLRAVDSSATLDCAFIAAASDNPDIFGPEAFHTYTMPGLTRLNRTARDLALPTIFHPHGDMSANANISLLDDILATGIEGFQFAERNDPRRLLKLMGGKIALMGGIDAFSTLLLGPEEKIIDETDAYLHLFHPWTGYVFMCSCSLHRGMPLENVEIMMRCARSYGLRKEYEP